MNLPKLFTELKRRNAYKVAVAYVVVGWLLIQVATQVFPFLEISNRAIRFVIFLTALGFPVALVIAWAFELRPEGIKRTEAAAAVRQRSRRGVWIAIVAITAALSSGLFFLGRYTPWRALSQVSEAAAASNALKSIAVLPLVNTSGDPSNEYFSDGLSEESVLYAARNEPDKMFEWLEGSYASHDSRLSQMAVTPFFLPYVNDPRFIALCQKLNVQVPSVPAKT